MECETSRPLSQYCLARVSEALFSAAVEGADQSVGSTGSHITKTRTGFPANSWTILSAAEAPCRHTVQVGESRSRTLASSLAGLNYVLISATFCAVTFSSGGCPKGT